MVCVIVFGSARSEGHWPILPGYLRSGLVHSLSSSFHDYYVKSETHLSGGGKSNKVKSKTLTIG